MLLHTADKGERTIQCDMFEARTFEPCRVITLDGDWYSIADIAKREDEGDWFVSLQQIERPEGIGPDRILFITGDAEVSDHE